MGQAYHPSYYAKRKQEDHGPDCLGINIRPYFKNNQSKKAGGMAQAVEHLPNKLKAKFNP
jgi:hypothetical protein